jgi:hypothetical protein
MRTPGGRLGHTQSDSELGNSRAACEIPGLRRSLVPDSDEDIGKVARVAQSVIDRGKLFGHGNGRVAGRDLCSRKMSVDEVFSRERNEPVLLDLLHPCRFHNPIAHPTTDIFDL